MSERITATLGDAAARDWQQYHRVTGQPASAWLADLYRTVAERPALVNRLLRAERVAAARARQIEDLEALARSPVTEAAEHERARAERGREQEIWAREREEWRQAREAHAAWVREAEARKADIKRQYVEWAEALEAVQAAGPAAVAALADQRQAEIEERAARRAREMHWAVTLWDPEALAALTARALQAGLLDEELNRRAAARAREWERERERKAEAQKRSLATYRRSREKQWRYGATPARARGDA